MVLMSCVPEIGWIRDIWNATVLSSDLTVLFYISRSFVCLCGIMSMWSKMHRIYIICFFVSKTFKCISEKNSLDIFITEVDLNTTTKQQCPCATSIKIHALWGRWNETDYISFPPWWHTFGTAYKDLALMQNYFLSPWEAIMVHSLKLSLPALAPPLANQVRMLLIGCWWAGCLMSLSTNTHIGSENARIFFT